MTDRVSGYGPNVRITCGVMTSSVFEPMMELLTLIDEFTRQCLAIVVARRLNSWNIIETLADAMLIHGVPQHVRSDNGPEMTAKVVRTWLPKVGTCPLYIEPGSPWENGHNESFNGKLRKRLA